MTTVLVLQMDVDSEDDQMMQAIALSLGQNVSSLESEVVCTSCRDTEQSHSMLCLYCCYRRRHHHHHCR